MPPLRYPLVYSVLPPFLATVLYSIFVVASNFSSPENFSWIFLSYEILMFYVYLASTLAAERLIIKSLLPLKPLRFIAAFVVAFLVSLFIGLLLYFLIKSAFITIYHQNDSVGFYHLYLRSLTVLVGFVIVFCIVLFIRHHTIALQRQLAEEQQEKERLRLQYDLLYSKLDPHFLFNNLNTLHSLIVEQNQGAEQFVVSLARIMRYSFGAQKEESVPIQRELEVLEDYIEIMQSRFTDALKFSVTNQGDLSRHILPMTLLHLIENVVKHNEIRVDIPVSISVNITAHQITVLNTLRPKRKVTTEVHHTGLKNLNEIYRVKFGRGISYERTDSHFRVTIPLLP